MTSQLRKLVWKKEGFWIEKDELLDMLKDVDGIVREKIFYGGKTLNGIFKGRASKTVAWFNKYTEYCAFDSELEALEDAIDYLNLADEDETEQLAELKIVEARFKKLGGEL